MEKTYSNGEKVGDILVVNRDAAPELVADGLNQMVVGYPHSRILLHTLIPVDPSAYGVREVRKVVATVTMPNLAMVDMALQILRAHLVNQTQIEDARTATGNQLKLLLKGLSVESLTTETSPSA